MPTNSGAYDKDDATNNETSMKSEHPATSGLASAASTDETLNAHVKGGADSVSGGATKGNGGKRHWLWLLIAAVVVVALIVAFMMLRKPKNQEAQGRQADTVTIGLKLAPTNLDIRNQSGSALDQLLVGNVYEGIVARDSNNKVIPSLAKSWEKSTDGMSYTFHLNQGMVFSNGDKLDAHDVAWSIEELVKRGYHDAESLQNFKSATATDANTVRIDLTAPYANLLWTLTGRPGLVFDQKAQYDPKTQAVGSGPYTIAKFTPNDSITLKANPKYRGINKAKTKTVILRYFGDDNAAVNALKSGDVQVLAPVTENLAAPFKKDSEHFTVSVGDDTDKYVLAMNSKGDKTSDKRVREAIRYGINHQELIASRGGADKPMGGPIPSLDPGYQDLTGLYSYNQTKAKALMKEAGYTPDHPLELRLTYANTYGTELGDQLRSQLKAIGIDLKVNVVEFSTWLQDVYNNKDYDLSLVDHNESHDFSQWVNTKYYYNYDNAHVRDLYNKAMAASTDKERDGYLAQAAKQVSKDAPADWLFNYRITTAMSKGVKGFPLNLNQTLLPLYGVTYTEAGK